MDSYSVIRSCLVFVMNSKSVKFSLFGELKTRTEQLSSPPSIILLLQQILIYDGNNYQIVRNNHPINLIKINHWIEIKKLIDIYRNLLSKNWSLLIVWMLLWLRIILIFTTCSTEQNGHDLIQERLEDYKWRYIIIQETLISTLNHNWSKHCQNAQYYIHITF